MIDNKGLIMKWIATDTGFEKRFNNPVQSVEYRENYEYNNNKTKHNDSFYLKVSGV